MRVVRFAVLVLAAFACGCLLPSFAGALPPGRHYELVSPPYTAGYGVSYIQGVAPDGETVVFSSLGSFAGEPANHIGFATGSSYVATRSAGGWSTGPLDVPASVAPYSAPALSDLSSDVGKSLFYGNFGPNTGAAQFENTEEAFFLHPTRALDPFGEFEIAGETLKHPHLQLNYEGGSSDLSHLVISTGSSYVALSPEAQGAKSDPQYDLVTDGSASYVIRVIPLNNKSKPGLLQPECHAVVGAGEYGVKLPTAKGHSQFDALADMGREIFFQSGTAPGCTGNEQLFVRLAGARTVEVSRPLEAGPFGGCVSEAGGVRGEVPCKRAGRAPAEFAGASEDGSKVFFMSEARLAGTDNDEGNDLYMATLGCPSSAPGCEVAQREVTNLMQLSHDPGSPAEVQGVVSVSPDGSHVYFVARGILSGENTEGGVPANGADNLYVYDGKSGSVAFIADLCTKALLSGEHADSQCPADLNTPRSIGTGAEVPTDEALWQYRPAAQTTGDGRSLVFSSYGQLTADDTDDARDVFRYDAVTGRLERVSVGEEGYDANGNRNDESGLNNADSAIVETFRSEQYNDMQSKIGNRAVTEDGSRIVFESGDPLSGKATNGLLNAYEWHEGEVSLLSSGSDESPIGVGPDTVAITPSGSDVFFFTVQKLLAQDTNQNPDVYDARFGIGFPPPPAPRQLCNGDACQGSLSSPAPLLVPGSVSQAAGENLPQPHARAVKKHKVKHKHRAKRHAGKRKHGAHASVAVARDRGRA